MTDTKTIEGNRLIAEFLGWEFKIEGRELYAYFEKELKFADRDAFLSGFLKRGLNYHDDWNKLMPVVEKIEEYIFPDDNDDPDKDTAFIRTFRKDMVRINRFALHHGKTRIEATYSAVIEFIHWYNKTQQDNEQ